MIFGSRQILVTYLLLFRFDSSPPDTDSDASGGSASGKKEKKEKKHKKAKTVVSCKSLNKCILAISPKFSCQHSCLSFAQPLSINLALFFFSIDPSVISEGLLNAAEKKPYS